MASGAPALEILLFGVILWLGLYLIARDPTQPRLRWAGLGLVTYALGLAADLLRAHAPTPALALNLTRLSWPLLLLPALFWFGATVYLLPEETWPRPRLARLWSRAAGLLPATVLFFAFGLGLAGGPPAGPAAYLCVAPAVLLPLLLALLLVGRAFLAGQLRNPLGVLLTATLFFTLGVGLLLFPLAWLPRSWLLAALGGDLILLGLAVAVLDAFDEGETLLPDFFRSFDVSFFHALLFGGLVGLAIFLGTGVTFPMLLLWLATTAAAIAVQTFADPIQAALDRLALAGFPRLRQARAELRAAAGALPRLSQTVDLAALDEAEFARLTRRALSHFGNLPRLAASPLTGLPLVEARLARRGARADTLERAAELKSVLAESIARLKPRGGGDFGTSDEWRHYNALYFPYVAGLKPYSRRAEHAGLDPAAREALAWFRASVPERTLHNWQNAAARLVAQDLREQLKK